ncbi:hypothetical protein B0H67DRAFT_645522 [Lasiosphaeris hirsuta]|uniref:DUF6594 domain-containing protein n=1 Tax=Lasiosphaeris hirsuta TaxID=260670 RepID=A0AA40AHD4_9PEZI|nr:hypothetical protein B0H67DRAFT_645522 [Lasiosphaeris hirsuta]
MALEYLAASLCNTFKDIEDLERENREEGRHDYKEHRPENKFGEQKGVLMEKMIADIERYVRIFSNSVTVMNQSAPTTRIVNDFRWWAFGNIAPRPAENAFCANNYRLLGPRPSVIDSLMHSAFQVATDRYYKYFHPPTDTTTAGLPVIVNWSYTTLSIIAHIVIISIALTFLLLPLTLVYLLDLGKGVAVLLVVFFCLCFCIVFFVLGRVNTDHKFILLFAYTGVMATLLSNMGAGCRSGGD